MSQPYVTVENGIVHDSPRLTPRLELRRLVPDDAEAVGELRKDPEVMRFLGGPASENEARLRFERDLDHWKLHGYGLRVARLRESGEFVGMVGFRSFEGDPDLSYMLDRRWWGDGYATEAARSCLAWGFDELGAQLVRAMTDRGHRASQRVLTKIGLRYVEERVLWGLRQRCYVMTAGEWVLRDTSRATY